MEPIFNNIYGLEVRVEHKVPVQRFSDFTCQYHGSFLHTNCFYVVLKEGISKQEVGFSQFITLRSITLTELTKSSTHLPESIDLKLMINPNWSIEDIEKELILHKKRDNSG